MRRDTLFRIASMNKPITAVAVLSFVDDDPLNLDEPVDRLLPEFAERQVLRRPTVCSRTPFRRSARSLCASCPLRLGLR